MRRTGVGGAAYRRSMLASACLAPGCDAPRDDAAPIALCPHHAALVADAAVREDVLPHACVVCGSRIGIRFASGTVCATCEWRVGELPDADLAPPRVDVVYYLRYDDRIKIGTTANPRRRLSAIWHDELLAFERGDRFLERRRHAQFADDRYPRTEWFRASAALLSHVDAVAAGTGDPWDRLARWTSEAVARQG